MERQRGSQDEGKSDEAELKRERDWKKKKKKMQAEVQRKDEALLTFIII